MYDDYDIREIIDMAMYIYDSTDASVVEAAGIAVESALSEKIDRLKEPKNFGDKFNKKALIGMVEKGIQLLLKAGMKAVLKL